jgi:hypothetical protein
VGISSTLVPTSSRTAAAKSFGGSQTVEVFFEPAIVFVLLTRGISRETDERQLQDERAESKKVRRLTMK